LRPFKEGEFIVEYAGELKTSVDGDVSEDQTYIYHFKHMDKNYW